MALGGIDDLRCSDRGGYLATSETHNIWRDCVELSHSQRGIQVAR
jgi:hypothetical protein